MAQKPLESLGPIVRKQRGHRKLREVAHEIGISPATLMRVEEGRVPDLKTFGKICKWLGRDPREFLGFDKAQGKTGNGGTSGQALSISVHFRTDKMPKERTVKALAQMLLLAARTQPRAPKD